MSKIVINTSPYYTYREENVQITMQWVDLSEAAEFIVIAIKKKKSMVDKRK